MNPIKTLLIISSLTLIAAGCTPNAQTNAPSEMHFEEATSTATVPEIERSLDDVLILYYGETCPHCHDVISQIENGRIDEYLKIEMKESFDNKDNYQEFYNHAQECKIPQHQIGVPLMWDGSTCHIGVDNVMEELGERMKLVEQ